MQSRQHTGDDVTRRLRQIFHDVTLLLVAVVFAAAAEAAPRAELVMDMRTGEVIHAVNADTQLHPASLTKMMTLYIAFEAIEHGEITADTLVTISRHAANEEPSKLGMRPGQKIALRHLIRAAAVKSANDAATAIGEAISGSEAAFARRMNRTARALGMTRTHFKNANGLTESGHLSTARDMTILGRHLFYDYPDYYHLFSRPKVVVSGKTLPNTNRRLLAAYRGADGIKTGYTRKAGFNLVASAERGSRRVIATVFGGASSAKRNARVAELLDLGFSKIPEQVAILRPGRPAYAGPGADAGLRAASLAPLRSPRPKRRPERSVPPIEVTAAIAAEVESVLEELEAVETAAVPDAVPVSEIPRIRPRPNPHRTAGLSPAVLTELVDSAVDAVAGAEVQTGAQMVTRAAPRTVLGLAEAAENPDVAQGGVPGAVPDAGQPDQYGGISFDPVEPLPPEETGPQEIQRISTSGGRHWGINVGSFATRDQADRVLIRTALAELATLGEALRKVVQGTKGFDANFVGLTAEGAELACRRLAARNTDCRVFGPPG